MRELTRAELAEARDLDLGAGSWVRIEESMLEPFAESSYLVLAMLPMLLHELLSVTDARMGVNYGIEEVHFPAPLPAGAEVRAVARILGSEPRGEGLLYRVGVEVELRGEPDPALAGEVLYLVY